LNFFQLVQRLRQEAGIPGDGPDTVVAQTGQMKKLVDWTAQAWSDIQSLHDDWLFLRQDFSFNTTASVGDYTANGAPGVGANLADFRNWHPGTLRLYTTSAGVADEQFLVEWTYQGFRDTYRYSTQIDGRPAVFAQRLRDSALMLGPAPDTTYTVRGEYQRAPVLLTADAQVPEIPDHLQMIIVWKALMSYAIYEAAPEALAQAQVGYNALLRQMEDEELPELCVGLPLA
jgi:hypothetical protein